jgi:hypothetical protein
MIDLDALKQKVMASNGGAPISRSSASGLKYKNQMGKSGMSGARNQGFLVGEAARVAAVATSSASLASVGGGKSEEKSKSSGKKSRKKGVGEEKEKSSAMLMSLLNKSSRFR